MRWIEEGRQASGYLAIGFLLAPLASTLASAQSPSKYAAAGSACGGAGSPAVCGGDRRRPWGADSGARLSDHLLEKDLVLTLSVRLRSM